MILPGGDLAARLPAALALLAGAFAAWALAVAWLERRRVSSAAALLGVALVLRLLMLPLPPTLSDDVWRYLWDGRVVLAGANPYRLAPASPELASLRDGLWERLAHREVPTVYPPLALGGFSIAAAAPLPAHGSAVLLKGLLVVADLAACGALVALARRRGLPDARAAWYAWNPLVVLEVAGMGHVDALGVAAAVGAVLALTPRGAPRPGTGGERYGTGGGAVVAGGAAALGVLAKLAPLAALPMWSRQSGRPVRFLAAALGLACAGLLPVVLATGGTPPGLVTYGVRWEFAGPLHEPLWRALEAAGAAPALAAGLDAAKQATGWHAGINRLYPVLYPQLLAKLLLAVGAAALVLRSLAWRDPLAGSRRLFGGLLLCSATLYPWYLLWVLPWAALTRSVPWLLASALAPLLYLPQLGAVPLFPWVLAAVWGPPAAAAAWSAARSHRRPEGQSA